MVALPLSGSGIPGSSGGIFAEAASKGRLSPCLAGATASMRVGLLPRQRDCRADAVALGAWERWHAEGVTERASLGNEEISRAHFRNKRSAFENYRFELSSMTASMRRTAGVESVETTYSFREQTLRVWELRICIALRGRRHGSLLIPSVL